MYDALDIAYKTNDKEYKIEKLTGVILYKDKKLNNAIKKWIVFWRYKKYFST